jgi:hypothetical protein
MFSLARTLLSPVSAEDRSSLFVWFIDTMARSDSSRACASALWLGAFADRPRSRLGRGAPEVSRFSCMLFLSVPGFSDYAGPRWSRCLLPCRTLSFPATCRFIPAHPDQRTYRANGFHSPAKEITPAHDKNECSNFVVVIGSERFKSNANEPTQNPCNWLGNIIQPKSFSTLQHSPLFS